MNNLISFAAGVIFALGLGLSGMTQPAKVIGFLDVVSGWDPSLAFVMVGAIGVHFVAYRFQPKMIQPVFEESFQVPSRTDFSPQLLAGAALFGIGWGLGGICPGPALVALTSLEESMIVFVGSMVLGMVGYHQLWMRIFPQASVNQPAEALAEAMEEG
jgi:uncharacterized protein